MKSIQGIKLKFIESAILHSESNESGDYKAGNQAFNEIKSAVNELRKINALEELSPLLDHKDFGVQVWAATFYLMVNEKKAVRVLKKVSKANIKHTSFSAKMVLMEWNTGSMTFEYLDK